MSDDTPPVSGDTTPPKGSIVDVLAMMRSAKVHDDAAAAQAALDELHGRLDQVEADAAKANPVLQKIASLVHTVRAEMDAAALELNGAPTVIRAAFEELKLAVDVTDDVVTKAGL